MTAELPVGTESAALRCADSDREQVVRLLNTAFAEGRLTREEHDERIDATWVSRTFGDLQASPLTSAPRPPRRPGRRPSALGRARRPRHRPEVHRPQPPAPPVHAAQGPLGRL